MKAIGNGWNFWANANNNCSLTISWYGNLSFSEDFPV
jgi:hypothetical protein